MQNDILRERKSISKDGVLVVVLPYNIEPGKIFKLRFFNTGRPSNDFETFFISNTGLALALYEIMRNFFILLLIQSILFLLSLYY